MGTDFLYYIMDYSGNYYRLNQADELVAAACEQEATIFTFAQANRRICIGKKAAFYCMVPVEENADKEDEMKCNATGQYIAAQMRKESEEKTENLISTLKELTYDEVAEQVNKNVSSYDLSEMDWSEYLTHFIYLVEGMKDYRDELSKKHSDIDQKICDILHYIELCETNDDEAVDLVELLRVCRENRRDIKDELQKIEYFQTNLGTNANAAKAKQALKSIKGLETRKYKPRKYDELFENCVMKEKCLRKEDVYEEQEAERTRRIQPFHVEHTYKNKGGEAVMNQERKYTSFDGKENDWLTFARQQAEFYRNAEQYIKNLQVTISEIDEEIEEILHQTENANCNVAQGYKIFKRLKDLRLERKEKSQELNCLYVLTDYIDCDALADTCEANLIEVEEIMGESGAADVINGQAVNLTGQEIYEEAEEVRDMVV